VVDLDPLADAVRAGAEDDDARLRAGLRLQAAPARPGPRGRRPGGRLVGFAPGRVVVVGRGLDLARARVDAAVRGPDAAVAAALADGLLGCPPSRCNLGVREAEPLETEEIVRDERLDVADGLESREDPVE